MPPRVSAGTNLAGYEVEAVLGTGASGDVYLARDLKDGSRVALKVLTSELADDERFRRRFLRESTIAAALDHPNVVSIVAAGESDGVLYLAMRYIEGTDLRELLRRQRRLDPERAVSLVGQVAVALDAAHDAGLVHRDVKPANVLVAEEPTGEHAVVCDFGLARHISSTSSLTGDRGFVGTIDYIAPEQVEGKTVDARADLYSLACVLFECLVGAKPFERESELSVVYAHLNEAPPRVSALRPELPRELDRVFASALAKSPDDRYATCAELMRATRAALRGRALPRPSSRRRRWLTAIVALLAAGALLGVLRVDTVSSPAVSISSSAIAGARLGSSDYQLRTLWGDGYRKFRLDYPRDYSMLTHSTRKVAAYFKPGNPSAIEITTWNPADRTAEGVGPCSTVDDLNRAFGDRLKAARASTVNGRVHGYTVGENLFFAIAPDGEHVQAVALHVNPIAEAGYIALNEGPCSAT